MAKSVCMSIDGVHDFKPRFDEIFNPNMNSVLEKIIEGKLSDKFRLGEGALSEIIYDLKEKHYVCDVCTLCGEMIKRQ